jgi:hypothetical protein
MILPLTTSNLFKNYHTLPLSSITLINGFIVNKSNNTTEKIKVTKIAIPQINLEDHFLLPEDVPPREDMQNEVDNKVFLGKANFSNKSFCFCFVDGEARDGEGLNSSKDEGCGVD